MIGKLRSSLSLRLLECNRVDILKSMGYPQPTERNLARLGKVLADRDMGLNDGAYDLRYSDEEFLRTLCSALGVDDALVDVEIAAIVSEHECQVAAFKPYLWVDTGFTRKNQPLFALAALEQFRYLDFEPTFWRLPLHEQIARAGQRIREHMESTGGDLPVWGRVQQYWFFHSRDWAYLLGVTGEIIGECEGPVPSRSGGTRQWSASDNGKNKR